MHDFTRRALLQGGTALATAGALTGPALLEFAKAWAQSAPWKAEPGAKLLDPVDECVRLRKKKVRVESEYSELLSEGSGDIAGLAETEWGLAQLNYYRFHAQAALEHGNHALDGARKLGQQDLIARARAIHERVIALDTHNDIDPQNFTADCNYTMRLTTQVNLPKMKEGGLDVSFFIVYVGQGELTPAGYDNAYRLAIAKFDAVHRLTEQIAPREIAPGQEGKVMLRWTPVPGQVGSQVLAADLNTTDPRQPVLRARRSRRARYPCRQESGRSAAAPRGSPTAPAPRSSARAGRSTG